MPTNAVNTTGLDKGAPALPRITLYAQTIFRKLYDLYSLSRTYVRTSVLGKGTQYVTDAAAKG